MRSAGRRRLALPNDDSTLLALLCLHRGEEVVLDVTAPTQEGITAVQAMFGKLRSEVLSASA
jgi:hypothetical protein